MVRLLIVDDEKIISDGIRNTFNWKELGIEVAGTASDGEEALEMIAVQSPHILLTDICMPKMDGLELIREVKKLYPWIRVVVLSAYNDFRYAQEAIKYNVMGYLLKPLTWESITEVFTSICKDLLEEQSNTDTKLYEEDIFQIRQEQFIRKLLRGVNLKKNSILSEMEKARLTYLKDCCRVAVCQTIKPDLEMEQFVLESGRNFWRKYACPVIQYMDFMVVILNSNNTLSRNWCENKINEFKDSIRIDAVNSGLPDLDITIGAGNICHCITKLNQSYSQAVYAFSYKFFKGPGTLIFYQDIEAAGTAHAFKKTLSEISGSILNNILTGDYIKLNIDIQSAFEVLECRRGLPIEDIKVECMEMLFTLLARVEEKGCIFKSLNKSELAVNMRNIETFNGLKQYLKENLKALAGDIQGSRQDTAWFIKKARDYVYNNYMNKITLEEIAENLHVNSNYFSGEFKKKTGKSFVDFITEVRMEKAKELLANPEYIIKEIAPEVGYDDYSYFCKVFKKYEGCTPLKYRSQISII